jgi:hypothetical protein
MLYLSEISNNIMITSIAVFAASFTVIICLSSIIPFVYAQIDISGATNLSPEKNEIVSRSGLPPSPSPSPSPNNFMDLWEAAEQKRKSNVSQSDIIALGQANTIVIKAKLDPVEQEAAFGLSIANPVIDFRFNTTSRELCPVGNCVYDIEDGLYRMNSFGFGFVFDGRLISSYTEGDNKKSTFYDMIARFDKVGLEESPSKSTEILEGSMTFEGSSSAPIIEYPTVTGTLEVNEESSTLNLIGVK